MSNNANAQAQMDNLRNVASQLKEMRHYAQSNTETLSAHWLAFDQGNAKIRRSPKPLTTY